MIKKSVWMDQDVYENIMYFLDEAKELDMSADEILTRMRRAMTAKNTDFLTLHD